MLYLSGPLHLGHVRFRGRNQRRSSPAPSSGSLLGGGFVVGGLVAREIPGARLHRPGTRVRQPGPLPLVVFITVINGLAEEMFFRGALYSALGKAPSRR